MNKNACVIALTEVGNRKVVFKNRDRNYVPSFKIYHVRAENGTEIIYFQDSISGWVEGINEYGIAITNAALAVVSDEKEGKKRRPGDRNRFSRDAWRFLKALECKSLLEALNVMTNYKDGVRGHNIVTDDRNTFIVETTSEHAPKVEEITDKHFVRTNHGFRHPDAGYLEGENRKSSELRLEKALKVMESSNKYPSDIIKKLYKQGLKDIHSPYNVVRKTDNMFTSNQIILDPAKKKMTVFVIDEGSIYEGYEKHFKGKSKCKVSIQRVHLNDTADVCITKLPLNKIAPTLMPPHENTLKIFAYGSLMYEPPFPDLICHKEKAHLNNLSREFNLMSSKRNHIVLGTKPSGSMQGILLEYPIKEAEKVLKELDKREGYQINKPLESKYLRSKGYAFTDSNPQGEFCLVYITNEESKHYLGRSKSYIELCKNEFLENDDAIEYLRNARIELKSINAHDVYLTKVQHTIIDLKRKSEGKEPTYGMV